MGRRRGEASAYAKDMDGPMIIQGAGTFWIIPFVKKCEFVGLQKQKKWEV